MTTAKEIVDIMLEMENREQRQVLSRFFKTGLGDYGEGDRFIGMKVPQTRAVVKEARLDVPLSEIEKLLYSEWHEVRLCGFLLLVEEMKQVMPKSTRKRSVADADTQKLQSKRRKEIFEFYLRHACRANNWDLVDLSCGPIVGAYLLCPEDDGSMPDRRILDRLAVSTCLWKQRIAIVSTIALIKAQQYDDTLRIAAKLLSHPHDLIHKAVGWMLREVGKQDMDTLRTFLSEYYSSMSRTTLRYAIERMDAEERVYWLKR